MQSPREILDIAYKQAAAHLSKTIVKNPEILNRTESICRNTQNRACTRVLLASLLAKVHNSAVDIRKPYTEIGDSDSYSGRTYDESYISEFIVNHKLPCNPTTAFLTPALRNRNVTLTPDLNLVGRPPKLYKDLLQLLTDVHTKKVTPEDLLAETIRCLINLREEKQKRIKSLIAELKDSGEVIPLSAEAIVTLIHQHLSCRGASRLPVLIVAAAYQAAEKHLGVICPSPRKGIFQKSVYPNNNPQTLL